MAEPSRYSISQKGAELENGILKNKLGIKDQEELGQAETIFLLDAYSYFLKKQKNKTLNFNVDLIFRIHHQCFSKLYDWAGYIRSVDISKNGFLFCPAVRIKDNLEKFEEVLKENLPKKEDNPKTIAQKLAIIHNEFNVIHPFREGNGRTIRLFLDLILDKLGYQGLNYDRMEQREYFEACKQGVLLNHEPMAEIFYKGLEKMKN